MFKNLSKTFGRQTTFSIPKCYKGDSVEVQVLQELKEGYEKLLKSDSKSLLKKHLTPELFDKLKTKHTNTSSLLDCIRSGLIHHDSPSGIYAACPGCYTVFQELFDPIIEDLHPGFKRTDTQPPVDFGDLSLFDDIDPRNNFIATTRIGCARSVKGYPFNPSMTIEHYDEIEDKLHCISSGFEGEFKGTFHSLCCLDKPVRSRLEADQHLVRPDDKFLSAANAFQYWPTGRGIFCNFDRTFLVWCNAEDHLSVTSIQRGGNFGEVYARLVEGLGALEKYLPFRRDDRLGFLTFCPTNLGTGLRASVRIRIPKMASNRSALEDVAQRYKLLIRGIGGGGTAEGGFHEISNGRRLGLTEFSAVSDVYCGVREIIQLEKGLPVTRKSAQPKSDPQMSELIDGRKGKRPLKDVEGTKKDSAEKCCQQQPVKHSTANGQGKQTAEGKPKKKPTSSKQAPTKKETAKKITNKPVTKKTECLAPPKATKQSPKKTNVSKSCSTISTQSTDPCVRAGIKLPKAPNKSDPARCVLQRNKRMPKMCSTFKAPSEKSTEKTPTSDSKVSSSDKDKKKPPKK